MGGPSQTEVDRAEVDGVQLQTVEQRLASGSDMKARTAANIAPEKRKAIEDMLRRGVPVSRIAVETSSGNGTVALVREELIEREPELFKRSMSTTLQRIAHKAATTIERSIDNMMEEGVKPNQVPGLSVALGILIDKQAVLAGEPAVSVVEHRVKVDPDAVKEALLRLTQRPEADVINVTATASAGSDS